MSRFPLTPLVVLITGASSGIGEAAARLLAEQGASLALAARRADRLEKLAEDLKERFRSDVLVLPTDLRKPQDIEAMVRKTHERFGRIDVLINNAGVLFMEPLVSMPLETMRHLMDTNFWAVVHAVRSVAPIMERQGGGHIINVGSGVSRRALPFMAVYSATKFALAGLTESVRIELSAKNISFTTVYPGGVETDMPNRLDRSRLPAGYPNHAGMRISAERAARSVVGAIRTKPVEVYVPSWVRLFAWMGVLCPSLTDLFLRRNYKKAL